MDRRRLLQRLMRMFGIVFVLGLVTVLLDFAVDFRPRTIQESYRFTVPDLTLDEPVILRRDNLSLVVIRRSRAILDSIADGRGRPQDPESDASRQPADVDRRHRARNGEFFVAYAMGTDFGCPLAVDAGTLREVCSKARYDFAGRALRGEREFPNLTVPDYNFSPDYRVLTVFP